MSFDILACQDAQVFFPNSFMHRLAEEQATHKASARVR